MVIHTLVGLHRVKQHSQTWKNTPSTNQLPQIYFQVGPSVLLQNIKYSGTCSSSTIHDQGGNATNLLDLITNQQQTELSFQVPSVPTPFGGS